mgnify:CR=1 FL=1
MIINFLLNQIIWNVLLTVYDSTAIKRISKKLPIFVIATPSLLLSLNLVDQSHLAILDDSLEGRVIGIDQFGPLPS